MTLKSQLNIKCLEGKSCQGIHPEQYNNRTKTNVTIHQVKKQELFHSYGPKPGCEKTYDFWIIMCYIDRFFASLHTLICFSECLLMAIFRRVILLSTPGDEVIPMWQDLLERFYSVSTRLVIDENLRTNTFWYFPGIDIEHRFGKRVENGVSGIVATITEPPCWFTAAPWQA
jgi:hypothetical protein